MYKLLWFLLLLKGCRLPPNSPFFGKTCKPWSKQIIFFFSLAAILVYFYFWISIVNTKYAQKQWPRTPLKKRESEDKKRICRISHPLWAYCVSWTDIILSSRLRTTCNLFHWKKWLIEPSCLHRSHRSLLVPKMFCSSCVLVAFLDTAHIYALNTNILGTIVCSFL